MRAWFRYGLMAVVFFAGAPSLVHAASEKDAEALFTQAVNAYHGARYDEAVELNRSVLDKGYSSSALYYNLGNSYLKSGNLGKSIVSYLRAMRLTPRDSDLTSNLSFARTMVENYAPWRRDTIFAPAQKFWSEQELQWTAFAFFVLTGTFLLVGLYAGLQRKRIVLGMIILSLVTAYFIGAVVGRSLYRFSEAVCIQKSEARFEPSAQATVYFKIPEGTELKILRKKEGWFKVERSDGKTGWVPAAIVERI